VPAGARIILLGDREQLASVEAGAVFAELSASSTFSAECLRALEQLGVEPADLPSHGVGGAASAGPLVDTVVWLTENFRFDARSGPGQMAAAIRSGSVSGLIGALRDPLLIGADWLADAGQSAVPALIAQALQSYAPYLDAIAACATSGAPPEEALGRLSRLFEGFRVLCALRGGLRGVDAINAQVTAAVRRRHLHPDDPLEPSPWYAGRPVLIVRNDYTAGLFNGDTGIAWPDANGALQVWFSTGDGHFRALSPARLPDHETAWALSVHKSQGSEFDRVLIVLPEQTHPLLSRELIYTAVTRARIGACVGGCETVIAEAAMRPAWRASGLLERLRGA
jgi:exodeoxyribonuclease V alpha subunit